MRTGTRNLVALLVVICICDFCAAQSITVAAAADLQFAMQDVAAQFQKETGKEVKLIYGSSGNFFQQLRMVHRLTCSFRPISITQRSWNLPG